MPPKNDYKARPRKDGGWVVSRSNTCRPVSIHSSQSAAWKETRRLARGDSSEALLEDKYGMIRTRNIYGDLLGLLEG